MINVSNSAVLITDVREHAMCGVDKGSILELPVSTQRLMCLQIHLRSGPQNRWSCSPR
jgi:hypothetical protein